MWHFILVVGARAEEAEKNEMEMEMTHQALQFRRDIGMEHSRLEKSYLKKTFWQ